MANILNRDFVSEYPLQKIVTDLTYVRIGKKWHYICVILDLFNREIIGHSCGPKKDAELVKEAIQSIPYNLTGVSLFHTDRGSEFNNHLIDDVLLAFSIERSLSRKGCPYDNAVAESTYKSLKIEFIYPNHFETLEEWRKRILDYEFNHDKKGGKLGY